MKQQPTFGDLSTAVEDIQKTVNRIEMLMMSSALFIQSQMDQESAKQKQKHPSAQTLHPNISKAQIRKLHDLLTNVFEATFEQWRTLFSEDAIKMETPIGASAVADVGILLHHLKERGFIEASRYPSIVENSKAFSVNETIIQAKQISDLKSNMNFPMIGKNFDKIRKAVEKL